MTNTIRTAGFRALVDALVQARIDSGLTQRELAKLLGCQAATVANIESGQRRIDVIELIALSNALNVSAKEMFEIALLSVQSDELRGNFSRLSKSR